VLEDMLGEDKGHGLCRRRESGAKVESDIGIDSKVNVNVYPPMKTVLATTKLYFGMLR
jgi:hypothetical protein